MNNYSHINDLFLYFADFDNIKKDLRIKYINNESYRSNISTISSFLTHHKKDNQLYKNEIQKCHTLLKTARNESVEVIDHNEPLIILVDNMAEDNLNDLTAKITLIISLNYPMLRSDLSTVKIFNYFSTDNYIKDYTIFFNNLVKENNHQITIKLHSKHYYLIDKIIKLNQIKLNSKDTFYLLDFGDTIDRNAYFTKYINKISIKYLHKTYGVTDYRKLYINNAIKDKTPREVILTIDKLALQMNHSPQTCRDYYIRSMENHQ